MFPDFSFEQARWSEGYSYVIGIDEVGKGALAGPVVAGAAMMQPVVGSKQQVVRQKQICALGIRDSKELSAKKREALVILIEKFFYTGIGEGSVEEIHSLGIVRATHLAMGRAIRQLESRIMNDASRGDSIFFLVDGNVCPKIEGVEPRHMQAIIKGDQKSISIAAASIIAKVYRDDLMCKLSMIYPEYGFEMHKGYGTDFHRGNIRKHGCVSSHRIVFLSHI